MSLQYEILICLPTTTTNKIATHTCIFIHPSLSDLTAISVPWKAKVPEELPQEEETGGGWRRRLLSPFTSSSSKGLPDFQLEPESSEWLDDMTPKGRHISQPSLCCFPLNLSNPSYCVSYLQPGIVAAVIRALTVAAVVLTIAWSPTPSFINKHKG